MFGPEGNWLVLFPESPDVSRENKTNYFPRDHT